MREDRKTIRFDFEFEYPAHGRNERASAITVCEPPYAQRDVLRRMQAYVAEMQRGIMKTFTPEQLDEAARRREQGGSNQGEEPEAETAAIENLASMRMGLGVEEYVKFADYVQRALTNAKGLAFVGEDPDSRVPITDLVWVNLSNAGGMEAVDRVLSEFVGFFTATRPAPKVSTTPTGTGSSVPLAVAHQASSPTMKPARGPRSPA